MLSNVLCLFSHSVDIYRHSFVLQQCGETWSYWINHLLENIGYTTGLINQSAKSTDLIINVLT